MAVPTGLVRLWPSQQTRSWFGCSGILDDDPVVVTELAGTHALVLSSDVVAFEPDVDGGEGAAEVVGVAAQFGEVVAISLMSDPASLMSDSALLMSLLWDRRRA
jgi:hypothetical protein